MHQAGIGASSRYWCIKLVHQAGIGASSKYWCIKHGTFEDKKVVKRTSHTII
jgi:hypothetical protein